MEVIMRPRQGGKTTALINLARDNGGILIVRGQLEANILKRNYPEMADRIWSSGMFTTAKTRGFKIDKIYIDNADVLLMDVLHIPRLDGISLTGKEENGWDS